MIRNIRNKKIQNEKIWLCDENEINSDTIINDWKNIPYIDIQKNKIQHQHKDSECGVYCINFLYRMCENFPFTEFEK